MKTASYYEYVYVIIAYITHAGDSWHTIWLVTSLRPHLTSDWHWNLSWSVLSIHECVYYVSRLSFSFPSAWRVAGRPSARWVNCNKAIGCLVFSKQNVLNYVSANQRFKKETPLKADSEPGDRPDSPGRCDWQSFLTSASVGFWPRARNTSPICATWIWPSPLLSKIWNASWNSETPNRVWVRRRYFSKASQTNRPW